MNEWPGHGVEVVAVESPLLTALALAEFNSARSYARVVNSTGVVPLTTVASISHED